MLRFENDYTEGAHERILKRIVETNEEQTPGYGMDEYCEKARAYIRKACDVENADVHFLVGGTQSNTTIIASILRPHQGVVAAITGHIAVHETGAIEAAGHKVLILPNDVLMKLGKKYSFSFWEKADATHSVVRFCTSWGTKKENVEMLIEDIKKLEYGCLNGVLS